MDDVNKHDCDHDHVTEIIEYTLRQLHEAGECPGAPLCGYCQDDQERGEESRGG